MTHITAINDTSMEFVSFINIKEEDIDIDECNVFSCNIKDEPEELKIENEDNQVTCQNIPVDIVNKLETVSKINLSVYCKTCAVVYKSCCPKCEILLRILNKFTNEKISRASLPNNLLQIKYNSDIGDEGVFSLITIPKNVIFGPFEGLYSSNGRDGQVFLFENKRLVDIGIEQSNWLKYIRNTPALNQENLSVFQCGGLMFYRSTRVIKVNEELLVRYDESCFLDTERDGRKFFNPPIKKKIKLVYACMDCGLGYSSRYYLDQHLYKCPNNKRISSSDNVSTNCSIFKKNYTNIVKVKKRYRCLVCSYETDSKFTLTGHLRMHADIKPFHCELCDLKFNWKANLTSHIKNIHTGRDEKDFKCTMCPYQANYKKKLALHIKDKHSDEKDYKCSECSYRTNYIKHLNDHLNTHKPSRPFQCGICKAGFNQKNCFKRHIVRKHPDYEHIEVT